MTIRTKPASKEYRDGWDRVFGRKPVGPAAALEAMEEMAEALTHQIEVLDWHTHGPVTLTVHGAKPSAIRERKR